MSLLPIYIANLTGMAILLILLYASHARTLRDRLEDRIFTGLVIGALFGGIDFSTLKYVIRAADEAAGIEEAAIKYGSFIQAIVNFLLIAIVIFLLVKGINKMRRKKEEPAPAPAPDPEPSEEVKLLTEIRDALKK